MMGGWGLPVMVGTIAATGPTKVYFVDPANGDFRLRPDSPALKLGFVPIDLSKIGLRQDTDWDGQFILNVSYKRVEERKLR